MASNDLPAPERPLDHLVVALVEWGATASQIVSHMELSKRSGTSGSGDSTVEVFRRLVTETLAHQWPAPDEGLISTAAAVVAAVDETIRDEILLVPVPTSRLSARRGSRRRRGA